MEHTPSGIGKRSELRLQTQARYGGYVATEQLLSSLAKAQVDGTPCAVAQHLCLQHSALKRVRTCTHHSLCGACEFGCVTTSGCNQRCCTLVSHCTSGRRSQPSTMADAVYLTPACDMQESNPDRPGVGASQQLEQEVSPSHGQDDFKPSVEDYSVQTVLYLAPSCLLALNPPTSSAYHFETAQACTVLPDSQALREITSTVQPHP